MALVDEIDAAAVTGYLEGAGWVTERSSDRRSIWRHPSGLRVFVPEGVGSDTRELLRQAVREIADAEQRPENELASDLAWSGFDRLELRRAVPRAALTLGGGIDFHEAVRDLITAAARSVHAPRRRFKGPRPQVVQGYVSRVQLLPSVPGSFVVRALLPTRTAQEEDLGSRMLDVVESDARKMSQRIIRSAETALRVAWAIDAGGPVALWDEAIADGVSANLCGALARLPGTPETVDAGESTLRLTWTRSEPAPELPAVTVPVRLTSILLAGNAYLQDQPEEYETTLVGQVTAAVRSESHGPGDITLRAHDRHTGQVELFEIRLEQDEYHQAVDAHPVGIELRVAGLVRRTPRSKRMTRVDRFEVLDEL